jgi:hypothetical protein
MNTCKFCNGYETISTPEHNVPCPACRPSAELIGQIARKSIPFSHPQPAADDDRDLPADFVGCLPRIYDRRAIPRPEPWQTGFEARQLSDLIQAARRRAASAAN